MKISIIVPAYNEEAYIGNCLKSIIEHRTGDFLEVIVVDNASTDGTAAVAKGFPGVRVVREPEKGLTRARERGLLEAKGELVAYLDADTHMPPHWAGIVQEEFAKNPRLVCLSGPFHYYDLSPFKKFFAEGLWKVFAPPTYWALGFMVLGANFVAKRDALVTIGGFDTTIKFYGEDTDIARRFCKVGKVKFRMDFFIVASARRIIEQGLVKTFWIYGVNYLWGALRKKPYTKSYEDFR